MKQQGVTEQKYRDLLERGGLIADTVGTAGWAELVTFVGEQRSDLERRILDGNCKTHEAYIAAVEFIAGIDYVLNVSAMFQKKIVEHKNALAAAAEDAAAA